MVEQGLHLAFVIAIRNLQEEIPRFDFVERLSRPVLRVLDDDVDLLSGDLDEQRHRPDLDLLAVHDRDALAGLDARAADERAVRRAEVLDEDRLALGG